MSTSSTTRHMALRMLRCWRTALWLRCAKSVDSATPASRAASVTWRRDNGRPDLQAPAIRVARLLPPSTCRSALLAYARATPLRSAIQDNQWALVQRHSQAPAPLLWTCGTNDHGVPSRRGGPLGRRIVVLAQPARTASTAVPAPTVGHPSRGSNGEDRSASRLPALRSCRTSRGPPSGPIQPGMGSADHPLGPAPCPPSGEQYLGVDSDSRRKAAVCDGEQSSPRCRIGPHVHTSDSSRCPTSREATRSDPVFDRFPRRL